MPQGIEFINASGHLLLTTLFANPVVRQQGTQATVTNNIVSAVGLSKLVLTYTNASATSNPIPFIKGPNEFHFVSGGKAGGTWTWNYLFYDPVGTNIDYFVFDEPPNTYANNGIEIYADAPGAPLLFGMHSSLKPLRIEQVTTAVTALSATKTWAAAVGRRSGFRLWEPGALNSVNDPDPDWFALRSYGHTVDLLSNSVSFGNMDLDPAVSLMAGDDSPDMSQERNWSLGPAIVADVSGY